MTTLEYILHYCGVFVLTLAYSVEYWGSKTKRFGLDTSSYGTNPRSHNSCGFIKRIYPSRRFSAAFSIFANFKQIISSFLPYLSCHLVYIVNNIEPFVINHF